MPKKKQPWSHGDYFVVKQLDGFCSIGQILDLAMPHWVSCSFYNIRFPLDHAIEYNEPPLALEVDRLISVATVARKFLDTGRWEVRGHQEIALDRKFWPNEIFRNVGWVGAKMYDASILEKFLNAYCGLFPWDYAFDPHYFDNLLVSPDKKPHNLIYK